MDTSARSAVILVKQSQLHFLSAMRGAFICPGVPSTAATLACKEEKRMVHESMQGREHAIPLSSYQCVPRGERLTSID